ncbi:MAG: hypothetical protein KAT14_07620, partial [Candidatus Marinimicrobia bacterium]|nr:hypothetical protein [Candidatus Neomarinimicrobiota bacterium]
KCIIAKNKVDESKKKEFRVTDYQSACQTPKFQGKTGCVRLLQGSSYQSSVTSYQCHQPALHSPDPSGA